MAANEKRTDIEWVGGLVRVPAYVAGDNEPYRPEVLFWMDAEGAVLGSKVAKPGALLEIAAASLQRTMERPVFGQPRAPLRLRVASRELARTLQDAFPMLEIVFAPTPEIDAFVNLMRERFDADAAREQSYLSSGHSTEAMASFFHAAAELYRAEPWQNVPSDQHLFSVTIEELELKNAVLSVIGQLGESTGLLLFANRADFDAYFRALTSIVNGEEPELPPHLALHFERGAELATTSRKEILRHQWEVAGAEAHPWLMAMDEDLVARAPTSRELTLMDALCRALTLTLTERLPSFLAAWSGGAPARSTLPVATHDDEIVVTLCAAPAYLLRHNLTQGERGDQI